MYGLLEILQVLLLWNLKIVAMPRMQSVDWMEKRFAADGRELNSPLENRGIDLEDHRVVVEVEVEEEEVVVEVDLSTQKIVAMNVVREDITPETVTDLGEDRVVAADPLNASRSAVPVPAIGQGPVLAEEGPVPDPPREGVLELPEEAAVLAIGAPRRSAQDPSRDPDQGEKEDHDPTHDPQQEATVVQMTRSLYFKS